MRAALYIRESTERQGENWSPDAQERALREYAAKEGMTIADAQVWSECGTGRKDKRGGLHELVAAAEVGAFDAVLMFHSSRFFRNRLLAGEYKKALRERGIRVIALNVLGLDPNTATGAMMEGIQEGFDQYQSDLIGEWTKAGLREKQRQGHHIGALPVGYRRLPMKLPGPAGKPVPNPDGGRLIASDDAPHVRAGFVAYATGAVSTSDVARRLADAGVRTVRGDPLSVSGVMRMLASPIYCGRMLVGGEEVEADIEPLIDAETWQAVQNQLARRRRGASRNRRTRVYVLGGLLRCAADGAGWRGRTDPANRAKTKWVARYYCHGPKDLGCSGTVRVAPAAELEAAVEEAVIRRFSLDAKTRTQVVATLRSAQPADATKKRAKLEAELQRRDEIYALDGDRVKWLAKRDQITADLAALPTSNISALPPRTEAILDSLEGLVDRWAAWAPAARAALLRLLVREVVVDNGTVVAVVPTPEAMPVIVAASSPQRTPAAQTQVYAGGVHVLGLDRRRVA